MLSNLFDAYKKRDGAVADSPGARLITGTCDFVILKMENEQVGMTCRIDVRHAEFARAEGEKRAMHHMLNKALRGCTQSSLL